MERLPSLKALRAFDVVGDSGSLSRAAERLAVSQGAVSRLIRQLEDELGTALLERRHDGVSLTEAGHRLRQATHPAFQLLASGCADLRRRQMPHGVALACPGSFMIRWLIPRLGGLRRDHPDIRLRLQATDGPEDALSSGADIVVLNMAPPWPPGMQAERLAPDELGPVCSPALGRRLAAPEDLAGLTLLYTDSRPGAWDEWFRQAGAEPPAGAERLVFQHLSYMLEAALAGLGVAIAPRLLATEDLTAGRLVAPFGFIRGEQDYVALVPPGGTPERQTVLRWLIGQAEAGGGSPSYS